MDFETALREQITARPRLGLRGKRVLAVLDSRASAKRTRILARWEQHAAVVAGVELRANVGFDWSNIDWSALFEKILALILALLPLFA